MSDRIIGYLVLAVPRNGFTDTHTIFGKKVLFPTWTEAVAHASSLAVSAGAEPICLLRSSSQGDCARWHNVKIYELADGGAIYAQAIFAPAN